MLLLGPPDFGRPISRMKGRGSWLGSMLNKHLSYKHPHEFKEVVTIKTAGAVSKCSGANAIRILIRPNSLKPLFGTPLVRSKWL